MPYLLPRNPFHALLLGLVIVFAALALIGVEGEPGWLSRKAGSDAPEAAPPPAPSPAASATPEPAPSEAGETAEVSDEELVVDPVGEDPVGMSVDGADAGAAGEDAGDVPPGAPGEG